MKRNCKASAIDKVLRRLENRLTILLKKYDKRDDRYHEIRDAIDYCQKLSRKKDDYFMKRGGISDLKRTLKALIKDEIHWGKVRGCKTETRATLQSFVSY